MARYRCTVDFPARTDEEARAIFPGNLVEELPRGSSLKVENLERRKGLRWAVILAGILLAWVVIIRAAYQWCTS